MAHSSPSSPMLGPLLSTHISQKRRDFPDWLDLAKHYSSPLKKVKPTFDILPPPAETDADPRPSPSPTMAEQITERILARKRPYKPNNEERDLYYYGLAGNPRLIARTSCDVWVKPQRLSHDWQPRLEQRRKRYGAVRDGDPISAKWTRDFSMSIMQALEPNAWSFFFPIRILLQPDTENPNQPDNREEPETAQPIILLVAVPPDTMEWETGIDVALRCRKLLRDQGIMIEVEIREGIFASNAASSELEDLVDPESWSQSQHPWAKQELLPLLSYPGFPLTYLDENHSYGTLGQYLTLGDTDDVYGLTCRHVVVHQDEPTTKSCHQLTLTNNERQQHVQATNVGVEGIIKKLKDCQAFLDQTIQRLRDKQMKWEMVYQHEAADNKSKEFTDEDEKTLAVQDARIKHIQRVVDALKCISKKEERIIGHLVLHPPLEVKSQPPGIGYLRDWALVKMDEAKYPNGFKNQVYIPPYSPVFPMCSLEQAGFLQLVPQDEDKTTVKNRSSEASISESERKQLKENDTYKQAVAKKGATTDLTLGVRSSIEAVVREPGQDGKLDHTWKLLVLPWHDSSHFTKPGDSGSAVFDTSGQVIGMVVGRTSVMKNDGKRWRGLPVSSESPDRGRVLKIHLGKEVSPDEAPTAKGKDVHQLDNDRLDNEHTDVTFVSPIEWVFKDIEEFTGRKPRMC
ncbi:hypothetical protein F5Y16DRAFT_380250 [Xylariaceae sp. FL0255]|nr:hypothetical protein F5Y16DRAFT_380250 [Xylariaceae sp. FL0255]